MHQPRSVRIEPPSPPPTRTPGGRGRGGRERRGRCPEPSGADGLAVPTAPTPHPPARPPAPPAASPSPPVLGSKQRLRGRGWGGERLVSCIRHFATLPLCKRRASRWRRGAGCEDCAGSRGAGVDRRRPTGRWEACFGVAETERPTAAVTQSRRPSGALHGSWNPAKTLL